MRSSSIAAVQILKITSPGSDKNSFASTLAEDMLAVEQPLEIKILFGPEAVSYTHLDVYKRQLYSNAYSIRPG